MTPTRWHEQEISSTLNATQHALKSTLSGHVLVHGSPAELLLGWRLEQPQLSTVHQRVYSVDMVMHWAPHKCAAKCELCAELLHSALKQLRHHGRKGQRMIGCWRHLHEHIAQTLSETLLVAPIQKRDIVMKRLHDRRMPTHLVSIRQIKCTNLVRACKIHKPVARVASGKSFAQLDAATNEQGSAKPQVVFLEHVPPEVR
mmetsp:Transcript_172749/g.553755  ORF Transcript_172749/g.553755 Transcript_172749/m.553755 type:complete len:201 (+) Transcript_172749:565-1167(+)